MLSSWQVSLRLEEPEHECPKLRATIERRPVNEIIADAIREYARSLPIPREDMLAMVHATAKEDVPIPEALAYA